MTKADWRACKVTGRALLDKHGLTDWNVSVKDLSHLPGDQNTGGGRWGYAHFNHDANGNLQPGGTIYLPFTKPRGGFRQTMLHEIAHALCGPEAQHNPAWVKKALEIGCTWNHIVRSYIGEALDTAPDSAKGRVYCSFVRDLLPLNLAILRRNPELAEWATMSVECAADDERERLAAVANASDELRKKRGI